MKLTDFQEECLRKIYKLTPKEMVFVKLFVEGINDNEALSELSDNTLLTAKLHISHTYKKFHVNNKLGVVLKIIDVCKLLDYPLTKPPEEIVDIFKARYNLTNRETDLVKILLQGFTSNKDIGKEMNVKFGTSINYLKSMYKKTFTNNKLTLVMKFIEESKNAGDFRNKISDTDPGTENSSPDSNSY